MDRECGNQHFFKINGKMLGAQEMRFMNDSAIEI